MPVSQSDRSSTEICKFCDGICAILRWMMPLSCNCQPYPR